MLHPTSKETDEVSIGLDSQIVSCVGNNDLSTTKIVPFLHHNASPVVGWANYLVGRQLLCRRLMCALSARSKSNRSGSFGLIAEQRIPNRLFPRVMNNILLLVHTMRFTFSSFSFSPFFFFVRLSKFACKYIHIKYTIAHTPICCMHTIFTFAHSLQWPTTQTTSI